MIESVVYYSIQRVGNFGVLPSPIHSRAEKEMAENEARQTIKVTTGDLQIVVLVCDDLADPAIYQQINFLKRAAIGFEPGFAMSNYIEDSEGNDISEPEDFDDENGGME